MGLWGDATTGQRVAFAAALSTAIGGGLLYWGSPELARDIEVAIANPIDTFRGSGQEEPQDTAPAIDEPTCTDITSVSLDKRVGSMIILSGGQGDLPQIESAMIGNSIGSFVLLGDLNDGLADSVAQMESRVETANGVSPWFMLDEEGGQVQRSSSLTSFDQLPSAQDQANNLTEDQITQLYIDHGTRLLTLGVDVALAPVADTGPNVPISSRAYSFDNSDDVVRLAGAANAGYQRVGIKTTAKHWPGHGQASGDTHVTSAITPDLSVMLETEVPSFAGLLSQVDFVMAGHIEVPGLTQPGQPASISPESYTLLRQQPGGQNVITMTDDLANMTAITQATPDGKQETAAQLAVEAGADMVMINHTAANDTVRRLKQYYASPEGLNRINDASRRILSAQGMDLCRS